MILALLVESHLDNMPVKLGSGGVSFESSLLTTHDGRRTYADHNSSPLCAQVS